MCPCVGFKCNNLDARLRRCGNTFHGQMNCDLTLTNTHDHNRGFHDSHKPEDAAVLCAEDDINACLIAGMTNDKK